MARFAAQPHHCAGPRHFLNGGIIATLIDCHAVCTATAAAYLDQGRAIGSAPHLYFATTALDIRYLRPVPIDDVELAAEIEQRGECGYVIACRLSAAGKIRATASVEAVSVPDSWMDG